MTPLICVNMGSGNGFLPDGTMPLPELQGGDGVLHWVSDSDAHKNKGRNRTFSSFLLKYRGRNYTNFPGTWKGVVEMEEHM